MCTLSLDQYFSIQCVFRETFRIEKLLAHGHEEVFVHGLGSAVNRAIAVAMRVRARGLGSIDIETTTSSASLSENARQIYCSSLMLMSRYA